MRLCLIAILLTTASAYIIPGNNELIKPFELLDLKKNQQKLITRELKNQEQFLDNWCKKPRNTTLEYIVCEGFKIEQEFILAKLDHLDELENEIAYTLTLMPRKTYLSPNNYVLAKTSELKGESEDDKTFLLAIFKNAYKNHTIEEDLF